MRCQLLAGFFVAVPSGQRCYFCSEPDAERHLITTQR